MIKNTLIIKITRYFCFTVMFIFPSIAAAIHLDVEIWGEDDTLFAGYCRTPGVVGCDTDGLLEHFSLPANVLPVEAATGKFIFLTDFQDLSGGQFKTKNPGFQSIQSALLPNELISYRALGHLRYWDPAISTWVQAPPDVRIAVYGGLEASAGLSTDYNACAGQLLCFNADNFSTESNTLFSAQGVSGSKEMVIDITSESGILHTHLSFFLENQQGDLGGPAGAYLIEIQAFSNARPISSEPFLILFNAGLDDNQFSNALLSLIDQTNGNGQPGSVPENPVFPLSILGDVDLDGDVDRLDVALILLAAQNQDAVQAENVMFDVDNDGLITRQDSHLAKSLCSLRLCQIPSAVQAELIQKVAVFESTEKQLILNDVRIDSQQYRTILQQSEDNIFTLQSAVPAELPYAFPAYYKASNGLLEIPVLSVDKQYYRVTLRNIGDFNFRLETIKKIDHLLN
ncbi:hypothetical protein [Methyloprofundus sp.]|uniref:hypothetical protein n=1 Tax=Methyloprofundus sp. TaxID=2020875 RepID=UPI003D0B23C2